MLKKKYEKLNLDGDVGFSYEDEEVGPCKPGNAFFRWLGRGPPLKVPIPDAIIIGTNNFVKLIHNDPAKGHIVQHVPHFDSQDIRDQFVNTCVDHFIGHSKPLNDPPEPVHSRIVAVMKKPCLNPERTYKNQSCDIMLPFALAAQLQDAADGSIPPCVLQKFIKSRGRRPSIYRLFWRCAANDTSTAEGWNIAKDGDEFIAPELVVDLDKVKADEEAPDQQQERTHEQEELVFQRQTTKYIASILRSAYDQEYAQERQEQMLEGNRSPSPPPLASQQQQQVTNTTGSNKMAAIRSSVMRANANTVPEINAAIADAIAAVDKPSTGTNGRRGSVFGIRPMSAPPAAAAVEASIAETKRPFAAQLRKQEAVSGPALASSSSNSNAAVSNNVRAVTRRMDSALAFAQESTLQVASPALAPVKASHQPQHHLQDQPAQQRQARSPPRKNMQTMDFFRNKTPKQLDRDFVRGIKSRLHLSGGERSEAMAISARVSYLLAQRLTASFTTESGNLSDEKCAKLMLTRVSNSALAEPLQYMSEVVRWLHATLLLLNNVSIVLSEIVCDFIKDDDGRWWFTNLKGFKVTPETVPRVIIWHQINILGRPAEEVVKGRLLTAKERFLKHEAETGVLCRLCGLYYLDNASVVLAEEEIHKIKDTLVTEVPAFGYQVSMTAATAVVVIYHQNKVPLTLFGEGLLEASQAHDINTRSVTNLLHREGQNQTQSNKMRAEFTIGGPIVCCYHCYKVHDRFLKIQQRKLALYAMLGCNNSHTASSHNLGDTKTLHKNASKADLRDDSQEPDLHYLNFHHANDEKIAEINDDYHHHHSNHNSIHNSDITKVKQRPKSASAIALRKDVEERRASISLLRGQLQQFTSTQGNSTNKMQERMLAQQKKKQSNFIKKRSTQNDNSAHTYCAFHLLPREVSHWRIFIMMHCLTIEKPETDFVHRRSLQDEAFHLSYRIGQLDCHAEALFPVERIQAMSTKQHQLVVMLLKQCRVHSVCCTKNDLQQYLKEHMISMRLQLGSASKKNASNNSKADGVQSSHDKNAFYITTNQTNNHSNNNNSHNMKSMVTNPSASHSISHATFEVPLSELKLKDANVVAAGWEKSDVLLTLPVPGVARDVSLRLSIAIVRDPSLPPNLSSVDRFLVEDEKLYWPPIQYFPNYALPQVWLGMLSNISDQPDQSDTWLKLSKTNADDFDEEGNKTGFVALTALMDEELERDKQAKLSLSKTPVATMSRPLVARKVSLRRTLLRNVNSNSDENLNVMIPIAKSRSRSSSQPSSRNASPRLGYAQHGHDKEPALVLSNHHQDSGDYSDSESSDRDSPISSHNHHGNNASRRASKKKHELAVEAEQEAIKVERVRRGSKLIVIPHQHNEHVDPSLKGKRTEVIDHMYHALQAVSNEVIKHEQVDHNRHSQHNEHVIKHMLRKQYSVRIGEDIVESSFNTKIYTKAFHYYLQGIKKFLSLFEEKYNEHFEIVRKAVLRKSRQSTPFHTRDPHNEYGLQHQEENTQHDNDGHHHDKVESKSLLRDYMIIIKAVKKEFDAYKKAITEAEKSNHGTPTNGSNASSVENTYLGPMIRKVGSDDYNPAGPGMPLPLSKLIREPSGVLNLRVKEDKNSIFIRTPTNRPRSAAAVMQAPPLLSHHQKELQGDGSMKKKAKKEKDDLPFVHHSPHHHREQSNLVPKHDHDGYGTVFDSPAQPLLRKAVAHDHHNQQQKEQMQHHMQFNLSLHVDITPPPLQYMGIVSEEELPHISVELLESMMLSVKHMYVMEFLPEHMNWMTIKPLLLETLQVFLIKR